MGTDFEEWFKEQNFWHENSRREDFERVLELARINRIDQTLVLDICNMVIKAMRDEYGE